MSYGRLDNEGNLKTFPKDRAPPVEWPNKGEIELNDMKFKYGVDNPYVLKSLSLKIESCEKVGASLVFMLVLYNCVFTDWHCG